MSESANTPRKIKKPGLTSGMPMADYLADPCLVPSLNASTAISLVLESPLHAWTKHPRHPTPQPRKSNKAEDIGTVAHALLLEKSDTQVIVIRPQDYPSRTGTIPEGWTNNAIKAARNNALQRGLTPLLPDQMHTCLRMRDAAHEYIKALKKNRDPVIRSVGVAFDKGEAEVVAVAQEGPTWLRCRPDLISDDRNVVVHLKTTKRSARPDVFSRGLLHSMGYDIAIVFYQRVLAGALDAMPETHVILAQEQDPPHACSLIGLQNVYVSLMEHQVEIAVATWAKCMKTGRWPGYPPEIFYAEPRPWQVMDAEQADGRVDFLATDPLQDELGTQI